MSDYPTRTSEDGVSHVTLTKRQFMGSTVGLSLFGLGVTSTGLASAGDGGGDGGDGDPPSDDGPDRITHTVTLITGHTVIVTERRIPTTSTGDGTIDPAGSVERTYAVTEEDAGAFEIIEQSDGTYMIPDEANLDVLDREFFNIDYLVDFGYTDEQMDEIPVFARIDQDGPGTFSADRQFASTDAHSASLAKAQLSTQDVGTLTTGVDQLLLDRKAVIELDQSSGRVRAPQSRRTFDVDGSGMRIAVVDTGIDASHPDFDDRVVYEVDYSDDETVEDLNGHGTHVAGIAAGSGVESEGQYVGVAPGAELLNVKAMNQLGAGFISDIVSAIEDAVFQDADVINLSIGAPPVEDDPIVDAVNWAAEQGVTPVSSAGNLRNVDPFRTVTTPAIAEGALAVGASDEDEDPVFLSARGPADHSYLVKPELAAPGVEITAAGSGQASLDPYITLTGTSMSAPHVAGVVALLGEHLGSIDPEIARNRLVSTADFDHDQDIYKQGGGRVDSFEALDSDLMIHDGVLNLGQFGSEVDISTEVTIENVGDDPIEVEVDVSMQNEYEGEPLDDDVDISPSDVTLDAGESKEVTLSIESTGAFGYNAGAITFTAGDTSYRTIFGFSVGLAVSINKELHDDRVAAGDFPAGELVVLWSHDGEVEVAGTLGYDGSFSTLLFRDEATVSVWSSGGMPADEDRHQYRGQGDPILTVAEGVHLEEGHTTITLDENDTVLRHLDTSKIADEPTYEAFTDDEFYAHLIGHTDEGSLSFTRGFLEPFGILRAYYSPLEADGRTNAITDWRFWPTHDDMPNVWNVDDAYHLYEPTEEIPDTDTAVEVDPDELLAEEFTYHRDLDDQRLQVNNFAIPVDTETFPTGAYGRYSWIGADRVEQTWWRTPEIASYVEAWTDDRGAVIISSRMAAWRMEPLVGSTGESVTAEYNRYPLLQRVDNTFGTVVSPAEIFQWIRLVDQSPNPFDFSTSDGGGSGHYEVFLNGDLIDDHPWAGHAPVVHVTEDDAPELADLSDGDEVRIRLEAIDGSREPPMGFMTEYDIDYQVTNENRPPIVTNITVEGLDDNHLPAGQTVVWVTVEPVQEVAEPIDPAPTKPSSITSFEAYHADGSQQLIDPWLDDDGWTEASVVYEDPSTNRYGILVDGFDELVHFAIGAENDEGNRIRMTTGNAVQLTDGVDGTLPMHTEADAISSGSRGTVPVVIEATADIDPISDLDQDSLRFGSVSAVHCGEGATPDRVRPLGNGDLQVHFPAADTGFETERSPAAVMLYAETVDGASRLGADVVESVRTSGSRGGRP